MTIQMYGPKVGDFDPEPAVCGPGTETKVVHFQGGRNKNNISKKTNGCRKC